MKKKIEKIEATRNFRIKVYWPEIADKLTDMHFLVHDVNKDELNQADNGMIDLFSGCMRLGAMAARIIPDGQTRPDLEEFYPVIYFGKMSKDNPDKVCPYFFFNEFKPRPCDAVVNIHGGIEIGAENLKNILDLPTQEVLQGRRDRGETEFGNTPIVDTIAQEIQREMPRRIRKHPQETTRTRLVECERAI